MKNLLNVPTCHGCLQRMKDPVPLIQIDRHLGSTVMDRHEIHINGHPAVIMVMLCLPCAQLQMPRIEACIKQVLQEAREQGHMPHHYLKANGRGLRKTDSSHPSVPTEDPKSFVE